VQTGDAYTKPSRKAVQAIKDKVNAKTYRSTRNQDLDELIISLNRMLTGWARYHRHARCGESVRPLTRPSAWVRDPSHQVTGE
jgi:hypothetical protein